MFLYWRTQNFLKLDLRNERLIFDLRVYREFGTFTKA